MAEPTKRGRPAKPKFGPLKGVTREMVKMAEDRTDFLREPHPIAVMPLKALLANAWLQGVIDAGEAMEDRTDA